MSEAWQELGNPEDGGILVICDHASNTVPRDIDLGIDEALLDSHIAYDIGVAGLAEFLDVALGQAVSIGTILGGVSRLVVDYNRDEYDPAIIAVISDGHDIPGNRPDRNNRDMRMQNYYAPYHAHIAKTIATTRPAMIVSLHSFTPRLDTRPNEFREWDVGVLYNRDDRLARLAIPYLANAGMTVGDQQPYSGKSLNHTMNRHAEANAIPYLGLEIRQDWLDYDSNKFHEMIYLVPDVVEHCWRNLEELPPLRH
jgi:predicted N-formylglutamate amidohydrolase